MMVTGGAQMAGMLGLAVLLGLATDAPLGRTLFYGALAAMSSTAVVTKSYADRGELDTPHGREVVSILVFQDLCIVPLILLLPLLGREEGATGISVWTRMLASLAVMTALVIGGRFAVRRGCSTACYSRSAWGSSVSRRRW